MESEEEFISRLDRDSFYRITALRCAVKRGGQDGGIQGEAVDVFNLSEQYYAWLKGGGDTQKPRKEVFKKTEGIKKDKES